MMYKLKDIVSPGGDESVKGLADIGLFISYTPAVEIVSVVIVVEFVAAVERDTKCNLFVLFYLLTRQTEHAAGLNTISKFSIFIHFFNIHPVS